jgi:hypothetical protein
MAAKRNVNMYPQRQPRLPVVWSTQHALTAVGHAAQGNAARFSRSRQMVQALRQQFIYSEKRARDILFGQMEAILEQAPGPVTVSRLTRETAAAAREHARREGYDLSNWDTAAKATVNAMLAASVLLKGEGDPVPFSIAAPATPVAKLEQAYQDRTEAYLLEFLIRRLGDVTARDHTALAHALFRQFDRNIRMEDLEDRVAMLLASLSGRVGISEDGTYVTLDNPA